METRHIEQFSEVGGQRRNPGAGEDQKFVKWDNDLEKFVYSNAGAGQIDFNTKTVDGIVNKGDDATAGSYIWKLDSNKNPFWRKEDFLISTSREGGGNSAEFVMNDSTTKYLPLGALAWEDDVIFDFDLPGDKMILFDNTDSIDGSSNFKYDYDLNRVLTLGTKFFIDSQEILARGGTGSWFFGHGGVSLASIGNYNTSVGHYAGTYLGASSNNNLNLGAFSGGPDTSIVDTVNIGPYAGRTNITNDRLFISNDNYADSAASEAGSLIWGKFDDGWLRVNNRLYVSEEVRIGTFDVLNTPSGGMIQFVDAGGGLVKPKYYDEVAWQDFANSVDTYLSGVVYTGDGSVDKFTAGVLDFTLSDASTIGPIQIEIENYPFATSPSSPADIGLSSSDYGYLQISNNSFTDNKGFTHVADLKWDNGLGELQVPGTVKMASTSLYSASNGVFIYDGVHAYVRTGSAWVQLDNVPTTGEANTASNVGVGGVGLFKQKTSYDLEFKNINTSDARIGVNDDVPNNEVDLSLVLTVGGNNLTPSSSLTYTGEIFTTTTTPTGINPVINFKKIISDTVVITNSVDELRLEVTGAGGGEANTGTNLGAGIAVYKDTTAPTLNFKTFTAAGDHVTIAANGDGLHVDVDVDDLTFTFLGVASGTKDIMAASTGFTIEYKGLAVDATTGLILTNSTANDIIIEQNIPIPYFKAGAAGYFDFSTTYSGGSNTYTGGAVKNVKFSLAYDDDVRDADYGSTTAIGLFNLTIGDGLAWDNSAKVLYSTATPLSGDTNYSLHTVDIATTSSQHTLTFNLLDDAASVAPGWTGAEVIIPRDAVDVAKYTDGDDTVGTVKINKSNVVWTSATTQQLTLNETTGALSIAPELVTYDVQNTLLDVGNVAGINTKRSVARDNIGAAYVNGKIAQSFSADDLTAAGKLSATSVNDTHEIADIDILDSAVCGDGTITIAGNEAVYNDQDARIEQTTERTSIYIDHLVGTLDVYNVDEGSAVKLLTIDKDGNMYVKGNIYAGGDWESFDTDSLLTVGITP